MQIFFRPLSLPRSEALSRSARWLGSLPAQCAWVPALLLASALLSPAPLASAQTLARPGWAGSGLTSQSWWQTAVIYRVQPQSFQDSDGDGVGDLRGLAQRADYLQSIGVDAILLESHAVDPGFDDLLSDASRRHIRILVQLGQTPRPGTNQPPSAPTVQALIEEARSWLVRGAAGVYLPAPLLSSIARSSFRDAVSLVHELRAATESFPGERILLTADSPVLGASSSPGHRDVPHLIDGVVAVPTWDAATLRTKLALADSIATAEPLLEVARQLRASPPLPQDQQMGRDKILAALLLSSRGAVALTYGQEVGLAGSAPDPIMRWTPSNVTRAQTHATDADMNAIHYGEYHPYIPPLPSTVLGPQPRLPKVALDTASAPPPADPDSLPGFTARSTPAPIVRPEDRTVNVALEDPNPDSLLNFYRRVLELHSGNATLRNGSVSFLNHDSEGAVVWLRRAPTGARTVASALVACNMTDHPIELSLDGDLASLHLSPGVLRPLLTSAHPDHVTQPTGRLRLSPHSVFVGELYRR